MYTHIRPDSDDIYNCGEDCRGRLNNYRSSRRDFNALKSRNVSDKDIEISREL